MEIVLTVWRIRCSATDFGLVGKFLQVLFTYLSLSLFRPEFPRAFDQSSQMRWSKTSNLQGASTTRLMRWTETDNLRLIEAVILVEEEMKNELKRMGQHGNGNGANKWRRIAEQLPPELQDKTWNSRTQSYGGRYKCQSQFCTLIQGYRDRLAGRATQASKYPPSESVVEMIKWREDLLDGTCVAQVKRSSEARRQLSFDARKSSHQQLLLTLSDSSGGQSTSSAEDDYFKAGIAEETVLNHPSASDEQRHSMSSPDLQYFMSSANGSFDRNRELGVVKRVRNFSKNVRRGEGTCIDQDELSEKDAVDCSQPSRSVNESKYPQNKSIRSQHSIKTRLQTREQNDSQIQDLRPAVRRQSTGRRHAKVKRKYRESRTVLESDQEQVQAIVERTVKKINIEVSRLSSWMEDHMVAAGQRVVHEIISSEIASDKRRKFIGQRPCSFTVPEDFDEFARKTLSRIIDNQIGSSFQKLRFRFEEELKDTSLELAEKILNSYPHSMFETIV